MKKFVVATFFFLCFISYEVEAEISIKILEAPESVQIYAPVYVLAVVENTGATAEVVPLNHNDLPGFHFELSSANGHLPIANYQEDRGADHVEFLEPGGKYYLFSNIGSAMTEEGIYEVRASLKSDGTFVPNLETKERLVLESIPLQPGEHVQNYKCWAGQASSDTIKILVTKPVAQEDIDALNYVEEGKFFNEPEAKDGAAKDYTPPKDSPPFSLYFALSYRRLKELYPGSYYTYVAGLYAAQASFGTPSLVLEEIMQLQPTHPLVKITELLWLDSAGTEALAYGQNLNDRLSEVSSSNPSDYYKDYLAQVQRLIIENAGRITQEQ